MSTPVEARSSGPFWVSLDEKVIPMLLTANHGTLKVYLVLRLAVNSRRNGWFWKHGYQDLSGEAGVSDSTARRAITWLYSHGLIEVERRRGDDNQDLAHRFRVPTVGTVPPPPCCVECGSPWHQVTGCPQVAQKMDGQGDLFEATQNGSLDAPGDLGVSEVQPIPSGRLVGPNGEAADRCPQVDWWCDDPTTAPPQCQRHVAHDGDHDFGGGEGVTGDSPPPCHPCQPPPVTGDSPPLSPVTDQRQDQRVRTREASPPNPPAGGSGRPDPADGKAALRAAVAVVISELVEEASRGAVWSCAFCSCGAIYSGEDCARLDPRDGCTDCGANYIGSSSVLVELPVDMRGIGIAERFEPWVGLVADQVERKSGTLARLRAGDAGALRLVISRVRNRAVGVTCRERDVSNFVKEILGGVK